METTRDPSPARNRTRTLATAAACSWLFLVTLGCGGRDETRIPSPDGRLTFVAVPNPSRADARRYLCLYIRIVGADGAVRHEEQTGASSRLAWGVSWEGNSRVVLRSSDIGDLAWQLGADGVWRRTR
jgi:hypothetical protein